MRAAGRFTQTNSPAPPETFVPPFALLFADALASDFTAAKQLLLNQLMKSSQHHAETLIDLFRDAILALQTKLVDASNAAIDHLFDDGYTKLRNFGWLRKLWHVMVDFDPVELDKHANEVEQVCERAEVTFAWRIAVTPLLADS
jgi:hypothetical protein